MLKSYTLISKRRIRKIALTVIVISSSFSSFSQLSKTYIDSTVVQLATSLKDRYMDEGIGLKMNQLLLNNLSAGKYSTITSGNELVKYINLDLKSIIDDGHLSVYYSEKKLSALDGFRTKPTKEMRDEAMVRLKKDNFGLTEVKILPGNIGYIDFKYFGPLEPDMAAPILLKAMDTISSTQALIIDLRKCSGSMSEDFNMMFPGYFLSRSTLLSTTYFRSANRNKQNWSYGFVPGKKYLNKPVYILTSGSTFSGGEALAYDLQSFKRVTIIGDITGGAANPVGSITLNDNFGVNMPEAQVKNAVTGTNWEEVGVIPDVKVPAKKALIIAQLKAVDTLMQTSKDTVLQELKIIKQNLEKELPVFRKTTFKLAGYSNANKVNVIGDFNFWGKHVNPLQKDKNGIWSTTLEVPVGKIVYNFFVDYQKIIDPKNPNIDGNASYKIIE